MKTLCLFLMLASASAFAQTSQSCGTDPNPVLTSKTFSYTQSTDGAHTMRYYYLYAPTNLAANPTLWVMLHPTTPPATNQPLPCPFDQLPMETLASGQTNGINNNIIVLWPISTLNPNSGCTKFIWNAWELDYIWPGNPACSSPAFVPDDSGFIAALAGYVKQTYSNLGYTVKNVYVTGMSSGAFMAQRMGYEHKTLVQAVGAASGQIWAAAHGTTPTMPTVPTSTTVLMLNGDIDGTVDYCGQPSGNGWGGSDFPPSDTSLQYWAGRSCSQQQLPQLCTGTNNQTVNTSVTTFTCGKTTFQREDQIPHTWVTGTESRMWKFFTTGVLPPNIISFMPTSGPVGTSVAINGGGFTGTTTVTFFNGSSATFTLNTDASVTATVPTGATTGRITITTTGGTAASTTSFTVTH